MLPFLGSVSCGFPSPAENYMERPLDLNDRFITHKSATYIVQAKGHSMTNAGIQSGDYLIVDRALPVRNGDIIMARLDNRFTIKRFVRNGKSYSLHAAHPDHAPIPLSEGVDFEVWGVVTYSIHPTRV